MRVLIYWEQDSWGGVDTHLLELLETWPSSDDEIVLMVNVGNAGFARLQDRFSALPHVRCVSVSSCSHNELSRRCRQRPFLRYFSRVLYFLQPLTFLFSVRQLQRHFSDQGQFDLLLANNGGYPAAWGTLCALDAGARAGIPARLLLVHHAATVAAPFMGWFEQLVDRKVSRLLTALVCVSWATRASLLERRWLDEESVRMRVIHNGISPSTELPAKNFLNIRATVRAKPGERLVGIAGRVDAYKGQEDLIFALARISPAERESIRLVIIGSGDVVELDRLRRLAVSLKVDDRVHLLGYLPGRPVDLLGQLDLLVMATRSFEGFGLTLIEAMSAGVPVLATSVGAVPEFVDAENGMLIPPGSPRHIAEALSSFLADPVPWLKRAKVAQERLRNQTVNMAVEYRQLFVECLA
jgi:glycosyltransferase involved in cell wall biosynthesis